MRRWWRTSGLLALTAVVSSACDSRSASVESTDFDIAPASTAMIVSTDEGFVPITQPPVDLASPRIQLGKRLFHDTRLSKDGTVACVKCHNVAEGGADTSAVSVGVGGVVGVRNSPSVLNSVHNFSQFWDGRSADLTEQAHLPIVDPKEMAGEWPVILERLAADAETVTAFARAGYANITAENVVDAIVAYESVLITPSGFDRWLLGEANALSEQEVHGAKLFVDLGCASCHQGRNVGGNMFQKFGVVGNYYDNRDEAQDLGRFNVTGRSRDRYVFKVPSLRNVLRTAPYFHDGSVATIEEAVEIMGRYQLGRELEASEVTLLVAFLGALSGEVDERLL